MKNLKIAVSVFMIMASIIGTAATKRTTTRRTTTKKPTSTSTKVGMANPVSVYCEKKGGKSINVKDKDGNEVGKCQFKNGTRVDEWSYYRENNPVNEEPKAIGMANPASVYCEKQGGESILVKSQKGDFGVCKLKDGTAREEWEYYRENNAAKPKEDTKVIGMANPASKFCVAKGGKSVIEKDKDGNEVGKCQFKNGTKIEEWEYYRENN